LRTIYRDWRGKASRIIATSAAKTLLESCLSRRGKVERVTVRGRGWRLVLFARRTSFGKRTPLRSAAVKTFTVSPEKNSEKERLHSKPPLNGKPLEKPMITWEEIQSARR